MADVLTFVFAFMISYSLFRWLGTTEHRRRHYKYADNGTWIALWAIAFTVTDWTSPGDASGESLDTAQIDGFGGDGGGGCGGCGGA